MQEINGSLVGFLLLILAGTIQEVDLGPGLERL